MQYFKIRIAGEDEQYLDNLTRDTGIEWDEVDFDFEEGIHIADITNRIIYKLFSEYIESLDFLTDTQKYTLQKKICTNCLASGIDNLEGFIEDENLQEHKDALYKIN